jgi:thiol-disulfide isomerase/thioredoxin
MKIIKIGAMWCPACIIVNRFWDELANNNKDIEFIKYDLDFDEEEVSKYNDLDILPVVIAEEENKEIKRMVGEHTIEEYQKFIEGLKDEEK